MSASPTVRLHLWTVPSVRIPSALARMGTHRLALRRMSATPDGPTFAKLLGTARPRSFTPTDTDPRRWAALTVWPSADAADQFDDSALARSWQLISDDVARLSLTPIASRGQWSRVEPFGSPEPFHTSGPVAVLTRARVRPQHLRTFWRMSSEVAVSVTGSQDVLLATGIGEAPIGLQGTFSVWRSATAMNAFARRDPRHQVVMDRAPGEDWYAEELFARFRVDAASGRFAGVNMSDLIAS